MLVHSSPLDLPCPGKSKAKTLGDNPKYFDGRLNPLLLLLPLALLVLTRKTAIRHRELLPFATYAILMVVLVFLLTDMRLRWIATIVPPLVVLATYSLEAIHKFLAQRLIAMHQVACKIEQEAKTRRF